MHAHCQNSLPQKLMWVLSWIFQRMLKGEDYFTKRQYMQTFVYTTVTATFTNITIISTATTYIATTCTA